MTLSRDHGLLVSVADDYHAVRDMRGAFQVPWKRTQFDQRFQSLAMHMLDGHRVVHAYLKIESVGNDKLALLIDVNDECRVL